MCATALASPIPHRSTEASATESKTDDGNADVAAARAELEALYREHGRRILALAWRSVRDHDEAADIVQEAFVKAHQALPSFRGRTPHYAWLYRVVVNICIDRRRRRERWANVECALGDVWWPAGREFEEPERSADRDRVRKAILDGIQGLSPTHRMVIVLREFGGCSYSEIAEAMRCRRGTVMSRLFHARRRLRMLLQAELGHELGTEAAEGQIGQALAEAC